MNLCIAIIAVKNVQSNMINDMDTLWQQIKEEQEKVFHTAKGLEFTYTVKGYELFVDRKKKSLTKATIERAYNRAEELDFVVSGPKKLGVFGASYIYPIFLKLGIVNGK